MNHYHCRDCDRGHEATAYAMTCPDCGGPLDGGRPSGGRRRWEPRPTSPTGS